MSTVTIVHVKSEDKKAAADAAAVSDAAARSSPGEQLGTVRFPLDFIQATVVRAVECSHGRVRCNAGCVSVLGKDIAGLIVGGDRGDQYGGRCDYGRFHVSGVEEQQGER